MLNIQMYGPTWSDDAQKTAIPVPFELWDALGKLRSTAVMPGGIVNGWRWNGSTFDSVTLSNLDLSAQAGVCGVKSQFASVTNTLPVARFVVTRTNDSIDRPTNQMRNIWVADETLDGVTRAGGNILGVPALAWATNRGRDEIYVAGSNAVGTYQVALLVRLNDHMNTNREGCFILRTTEPGGWLSGNSYDDYAGRLWFNWDTGYLTDSGITNAGGKFASPSAVRVLQPVASDPQLKILVFEFSQLMPITPDTANGAPADAQLAAQLRPSMDSGSFATQAMQVARLYFGPKLRELADWTIDDDFPAPAETIANGCRSVVVTESTSLPRAISVVAGRIAAPANDVTVVKANCTNGAAISVRHVKATDRLELSDGANTASVAASVWSTALAEAVTLGVEKTKAMLIVNGIERASISGAYDTLASFVIGGREDNTEIYSGEVVSARIHTDPAWVPVLPSLPLTAVEHELITPVRGRIYPVIG